MKKILFAIIIVFILSTNVFAMDENYVQSELSSSGAYNLGREFSPAATKNINDIFPYFNFSDIANNVSKGKVNFDILALMKRGLSLFLGEITKSISIMIKLILLAVLCSIIGTFETAKENEGIRSAAFFGCYALLAGVGVQCFSGSVQASTDLINGLELFMKSLMPIIITFLATSGSVLSATMLQPFLLLLLEIMSSTVLNVILPVIFCIVAFSIISNLSDKNSISSLVNLLKSFVKYSLGIMLTLFVGVISVQGFASSTVDGIGVKTAKYAVSSFFPMVGGILSDTVEMVISSSILVRNAIGIAGMITVFAVAVIPILKLSAQILIFKLTAAIIEPISDKRFVSSISSLAGAMSMLLICVISVMLFILIAITVLLKAGNSAAMFR